MPDFIDHLQAREAAESDAIQAAGRMPDPPAVLPTVRDCEDCGDPINPKRLAALPHTTQCVDCADLSDRRRHLAGFAR